MSGPLAGIRVVELTLAGAGPFAGACLAALGAEVIKLERPQGDTSLEVVPRLRGVSLSRLQFTEWRHGRPPLARCVGERRRGVAGASGSSHACEGYRTAISRSTPASARSRSTCTTKRTERSSAG